MPTLPRAVMSFALLHSVTQGINVYVTNHCEESMTLAHVTPGSVLTDEVSAGGSITKVMPIGTGSHVFKSGIGAQATCTCVWSFFTFVLYSQKSFLLVLSCILILLVVQKRSTLTVLLIFLSFFWFDLSLLLYWFGYEI